MPERPQHAPARRLLWSLVCGLLAIALVVASVVVAPAVLAEVDPAGGAPAGTGADAASSETGGPSGISAPTVSSSSGASSGASPGSTPAATVDASQNGAAADVDADVVQKALDSALQDAPGTAGAAVLDVGSGELVARESETRAVIPASNQKLLTALSLAEHLDPQERLATTVLAGEDPTRLTLVAGGDTLLAPGHGDPDAVNGHAGLGTLAQQTAAALRKRSPEGVDGAVSVSLDTSLFTGEDLNPAWDQEDVTSGEITRVAPIALYSHRVPTAQGEDPGSQGDRPSDPARAAGQAFADRLSEALDGAQVTLEDRSTSAPEGASEIARVESAPVHEQSAYMLEHSDNSLAETLARVAAVASGREGSVAAVQQLLPETLEAHGIETTGLRVLDASGMALADRVTPLTLARTVQTLVTEQRFAPYGRGLPVGGGAGTLAQRFDDADEAAARGVTRAKTGTLLDVASLSGWVQREDGAVLVYSLVLNGVEGKTDRARDTVDAAVADLAQTS